MEAKDKLEQDEAIYQAGKKAGIREVVEWMETYGGELYLDDGFTDKRYCITSDLWQAKLKEWGIK